MNPVHEPGWKRRTVRRPALRILGGLRNPGRWDRAKVLDNQRVRSSPSLRATDDWRMAERVGRVMGVVVDDCCGSGRVQRCRWPAAVDQRQRHWSGDGRSWWAGGVRSGSER